MILSSLTGIPVVQDGFSMSLASLILGNEDPNSRTSVARFSPTSVTYCIRDRRAPSRRPCCIVLFLLHAWVGKVYGHLPKGDAIPFSRTMVFGLTDHRLSSLRVIPPGWPGHPHPWARDQRLLGKIWLNASRSTLCWVRYSLLSPEINPSDPGYVCPPVLKRSRTSRDALRKPEPRSGEHKVRVGRMGHPVDVYVSHADTYFSAELAPPIHATILT